MTSANLIREARRRANLSQRELARRLGRPQSNVARWESGERRPSLETLLEVIRAAGLDLTFRLYSNDTSNDSFIWEALDADVEERLVRHTEAARGVETLKTRRSKHFDPLKVARALGDEGLRCVLVGRLAEALRGSPNLLLDHEVAVCLAEDAADEAGLAAVVKSLRGRPWTDSAEHPHEIPLERRVLAGARRWWIPSARAVLAVASTPPGTRGYDDLRRNSSPERLSSKVALQVASLLDLVRIADASWGEDSASLPQLQRTLELSSNYVPPGERPIVVPEGLEELFAAHGITT